jgi:hypothetical protein
LIELPLEIEEVRPPNQIRAINRDGAVVPL